MTDYAVLFARTTMERLRGELEVLARQVVRATTKAEREKIVREINGVRVRLNTARMVLEEDRAVKFAIWAVVFSNYEPPEVNSLWLDEVEAQKEADRKNAEYDCSSWRVEKMEVQREWREAADATEE